MVLHLLQKDPLDFGRSTSIHTCASVTDVTVHNGLLPLERPRPCSSHTMCQVKSAGMQQFPRGRQGGPTDYFDAFFPGVAHLVLHGGFKLLPRLPPGIIADQCHFQIIEQLANAFYLGFHLNAQLLTRGISHVALHALACLIY